MVPSGLPVKSRRTGKCIVCRNIKQLSVSVVTIFRYHVRARIPTPHSKKQNDITILQSMVNQINKTVDNKIYSTKYQSPFLFLSRSNCVISRRFSLPRSKLVYYLVYWQTVH
eukprot:sb/3477068/